MGEDKAFVSMGDKTMLEHLLSRVCRETSAVVINSNRAETRYQTIGYPVVGDDGDIAMRGPLSAIVTGLNYLKGQTNAGQWLLSLPVDTPFLPEVFIKTMLERCQTSSHKILLASFDGKVQHTLGFWHSSVLDALRDHLLKGTDWRVLPAITDIGYDVVAFTSSDGLEGINFNTPEDIEAAKKRMLV